MEQPLVLAQRRKFLEELAAEGEALWIQADAENWFGSAQGKRLAAQFLAQRLKSMQWEIQSLRETPLRRLLELICPRITEALPTVLLAQVSEGTNFIRRGRAGDAFRCPRGNRWELSADVLVPPICGEWRRVGNELHLEWRSSCGLPAFLDCPLYDSHGEALWGLFACGFAMQGFWDGSSELVRVRAWPGDEVSLGDFWASRRGSVSRCGWRFTCPGLGLGTLPKRARLTLRFEDGHPFLSLPGFAACWDRFEGMDIFPVLALRALESGCDFPSDLRACDPNSAFSSLAPLGGGLFPGRQVELESASLWLADWARWALGGHADADLDALFPSLECLRWLGWDGGLGRFVLTPCGSFPDYWNQLGKELASAHGVLRQCSWMAGSDYADGIRIMGGACP